MNTETIILLITTICGAIKAIYESRKAKWEAAARIAEQTRADDAEKTADAVIKGVEKAKTTLGEANLAQFLVDEIKIAATQDGVEEKLNQRVQKIKGTVRLDRNSLIDKLNEDKT